MQYTESGVCQGSTVLYRTQRVSNAENARMQAHQPGQGWAQGFWNHWRGCYRLPEGMKLSVTVMGLPVHSLCVDMCSCESPKGCTHTRHQQSRDLDQVPASPSSCEPGSALVQLCPLSRPRHYQYSDVSKSTLPHRNSQRIKCVWSICYMPNRGTTFRVLKFSRLLQTSWAAQTPFTFGTNYNTSKGYFETLMA